MPWGSGTWGDGQWGSGVSPTDAWATSLDPAIVGPGTFTLTIEAVDALGNPTVETVGQITIPGAPPETTPRNPFSVPLHIVSRWKTFVRDENLQIVGELDGWQSLGLIERWLAPGSWTIELEGADTDSAAVGFLTRNRAGIVIMRDDDVVLSGPVMERHIARNEDGTRSLVLSGPDDMIWLAARRCKPQPATDSPPYSVSAYDTRTGPASTVIYGYIDANVGPSATGGRQIPMLLDADPALGSDVAYKARYEQLLAVAAHLARLSDPRLSISLRQDVDTAQLRCTVAQVADRATAIVFSVDAGTVRSYEYTETFGAGNYLFGLGAGNGTARQIIERANGQSIITWGRYENISDQRQASTGAEFETGIAGDLAQTADARTIELALEPTRGNRWPTDWRTGDLVTCELDGVSIVETMAEAHVDVDATGETITPVVSNVVGPSLFRPVQRAALDRRLARLEAD